MIEGGFVFLPSQAPWLSEYLHELTTFPYAKYDDQADSTSQGLAWFSETPVDYLTIFHRTQTARVWISQGRSLQTIAAKFNVTVAEVQQWLGNDDRRNLARLHRPSLVCYKCGNEIEDNVSYQRDGGGAYHCLCPRDTPRG
jgi:hypothetical protein